MRARGEGRILVTGSIAGFMPGTYQAVYNGTKAFIDSFSFAQHLSRCVPIGICPNIKSFLSTSF